MRVLHGNTLMERAKRPSAQAFDLNAHLTAELPFSPVRVISETATN
jgi:hypothetical protein